MAAGYTKIKDWLTRFFSSLSLAVVLLIILAAVSVIGTFVPQDQEPQLYIARYGEDWYRRLKGLGIIDLYHSWGFRALTVMLGVNLAVCSLRRLKGIYRRTVHPVAERSPESIKGLRIFNELPAAGNVDVLEKALTEKKYRVTRSGGSMYGAKGVLGPWGDMITHLSILLVLFGALVGSLGFVGTVNVYEGDYTDEDYNWNTGRFEPLGFEIHVTKLTLQHYPVDMKVMVSERATGRTVVEVETKEGGSFTIPGTGYSVSVGQMDFEKPEAVLKVYEGGVLAGVYDTGLPDGGPQAPPMFFYRFRLMAFKNPILKSVASTVDIKKGGAVVEHGIIEVNKPIEYGGVSIYQAAFARDQEGRFYTGLQIVKDPGIPIVWTGFALLMAGLFMSFYFYHRQIWVLVEGDRILVGGTTNKDWPGFMREYSGVVKRFVQEAEP